MGKPLGNAHQNAACGKSYQFTNRRVFEGERGNRIQRAKPHGGLCLGRKNAGRPGIPAAAQETAGRNTGVLEQGRRVELGADYQTDSSACSDRESRSEDLSAAAVHREIHARRHSATGAGGPRARAVERAGYAMHPKARVCRVRQSEIHAVGGDLGGASVQLAEQRGVPEGGSGVRADAAEPGFDRGAPQAGPTRAAGVSAGRYRSPRGLGWQQGGVPHQCRRHRHANGK